MLKVRIIPTLLMNDLGLVKGVGFDSWRRVGTALPAVKVYNARDVDELILLDIAATRENRELDYAEISDFVLESYVPLTVGGGITELDHIHKALRVGADKVCLNTAAYRKPELIREGARQFGSQCIVVSIDARRTESGAHIAYSRSGTFNEQIEVTEWARKVEDWGAGEILITSVENDGTLGGYDLDLVRKVAQSVSIPVIASGGAGKAEHLLQALQSGAAAVAAASIFHFTEQTPAEMKAFLREHGIPVRGPS